MTEAQDVDTLLKDANEASGQTRNIWITFLLFGTYLAITVGAITHRELLLENPVQLPVLDVGLSLFAFYWVAPLFFVILHLYLLLQIYVLSGKLQLLNGAAHRELKLSSDRRRLRQRVDGFPVTQMLAGPVLSWPYAALVRLIVVVTVFLAPALLLLTIQISFLGYHDEVITWWHRLLLVFDLGVSWMLWLRLRRTPDHVSPVAIKSRAKSGFGAWLPVLYVLPAAVFSLFVATIPDERIETVLLRSGPLHPDLACEAVRETWHLLQPWSWIETVPRWDPRSLAPRPLPTPGSSTSSSWGDDPEACKRDPQTWKPTAILFEASIDHLRGRQRAGFARNLIVSDPGPADESIAAPRILRGRDLRFAYLAGANLRQADLRGSDLSGAMLDDANLSEARLDCVDRTTCVTLTGASLSDARLDGATLSGAEMTRTRLYGASIVEASLRQADLSESHLHAANLSGTDLSGADLDAARLNGARLDGADLYEASLIGAQLEGASLRGAGLTAAKLDGASLAGADLSGALIRTDLVGTDLKGTRFAGADLRSAQLSLTALEPADDLAARFDLADLRGAQFVRRDLMPPEELWYVEDLDERTRAQIAEQGAAIRDREYAWSEDTGEASAMPFDLTRVVPPEGTVVLYTAWRIGGSDAGRPDYERKLAGLLGDLACAGEGAPQVAVALAERLQGSWERDRPSIRILARRLADPACTAAAKLPGSLASSLKALAEQSVPESPESAQGAE